MAKKITLNELKKLVNRVINEEEQSNDMHLYAIYENIENYIGASCDDLDYSSRRTINDIRERGDHLLNVLDDYISRIDDLKKFEESINNNFTDSDKAKNDYQPLYDWEEFEEEVNFELPRIVKDSFNTNLDDIEFYIKKIIVHIKDQISEIMAIKQNVEKRYVKSSETNKGYNFSLNENISNDKVEKAISAFKNKKKSFDMVGMGDDFIEMINQTTAPQINDVIDSGNADAIIEYYPGFSIDDFKQLILRMEQEGWIINYN